jgi:hypothetical protein
MHRPILTICLCLAAVGCNLRYGVKPYSAPTVAHASDVRTALSVIQDYAIEQGWTLTRYDLDAGVVEAQTRPYQEGPMRLRDHWVFHADAHSVSAQLRLEVETEDEDGVWEFETDVCAGYEYLRERQHLESIIDVLPERTQVRASL